MVRTSRTTAGSMVAKLLFMGLVCLLVAAIPGRAYGDTLALRSLKLSDSTVDAVATYQLQFTVPLAQTLGSIKLQICANDPLITDPCTAPGGFDISGATLSGQAGETGFSINLSGTDANTLLLSRTPLLAAGGVVGYTLTGVTNPSVDGTYYGRIQTFASNDASGPETDHGGLAFSMQSNIQVSAEVPPYLLFCAGVTITGFDCANASGNYLNMGTLHSGVTASAQSQLLAATNAAMGYTIWVNGSTMTSGNNVIDAMSAADVSRPGLSQFGINLVANATPLVGADPVGGGSAAPSSGYDQSDFYKFVPGDAIASVVTSDDFRKLTVSYIVNIQNAQPVGVYATTLTYTCLANF